uniref:Transducin (beta)-like 3 n=1 Tax=Sinocyclocheilus anshuiensis TaxID=1608454 RepID=A0A671STZ6_9TELE
SAVKSPVNNLVLVNYSCYICIFYVFCFSIQISHDEQYIVCTCGPKVNILQINTGKILHSIEQDDQEDITSFSLSPDDEMLVTASRALLLKQWDWKQEKCTRLWRAIHNVPVASMTFDCTSTLLATGGCDGSIKLWDVVKQYCTHNLRRSSGVVHLVEFHPDISRLQLFSSSVDCGIRIWDLRTSKCICVLESHYSAATALAFSPDGQTLISSGRDKICSVWDLEKKAVKRTVPVYEAVEGVVLLPGTSDFSQMGVKGEGLHFVTAGSKGVLRVWDSSSARCVFTRMLPDAPALKTGGRFRPAQSDAPSAHATVQQTEPGMVNHWACFSLLIKFVGYNDDILDVKFLGKDDTHIVVATNSSQLKVFELATNSCQILYGHTGDMTIFPNDKLLASGSQDRSAKLWSLADMSLLGVFRGHSRGVWCVQFSPVDQVLAKASADGSIKIWIIQDFSCLKVTIVSCSQNGINSFLWCTNNNFHSSKKTFLFIGYGCCVFFPRCLYMLYSFSALVCLYFSLSFSSCKDVTEVELAEEQAKQEDQVLKQQELSDLLHEKKYVKALGVAISLNQPHTALRVIREIRQQEDGIQELEKTLLKLRQDQKESLLRYCVVWNTNSRSCLDAQAVLQVLLTHLSPEEILQYQATRTHLEALIPYTERHMQRIGRLLQASMFLDYMWQKMRITGGIDR